jgi:hypothetical protein
MSPARAITSAASPDVSRADRRRARRYPIGLDVRYFTRNGSQSVQTGLARTQEISSSGLSFHPGTLLPVGASIELSLNWPYLLENSCHLQLIIWGRVVRSDQQVTAVKTSRHEFRTRGVQSFNRASLGRRAEQQPVPWTHFVGK